MIRNQENLDALMLLTLADGQGTSAEAWSDWKETLVWQLYRRTSQYLDDQAGFYEQQKIERETLHQAVVAQLSPDFAPEVEAHFEFMPDNYFRAFGVEEIAKHAQPFPAVSSSISTCRTDIRCGPRSRGSRFRNRATPPFRFAPGMGSNCWPKSRARSPSSRSIF